MNPERIILERLSLSHPHMTAEAVLRSELNSLGYHLSLTDLRRHLANLELKGQALVINTEDYSHLKITAAGLARIAE